MTLSLRPYQRAAIEALYDYFSASSGNPLVVMPTGTGKSLCIAGFTREAIAAYGDTRVLILTHVQELIQQNFMALLRAWPEAPAGIYSAGLSRRDIHAQILFAGIQSIHRHARQVQRCDLVLIDEAHLLGRGDSGMYRSFLAQLNEINAGLLKVVGFTATPYRLDSGMLHEGKDRLFTDIAFQVPVLEMIQQGYLCPVVPKQTSTQLDVGGVGTRGSRRISSSSNRPTRAPTLALGTVVILSTIRRDAARRPLRWFGSTARRNSGASVSSVVTAQTVMESVASKLSSCTMTTGRGLPA